MYDSSGRDKARRYWNDWAITLPRLLIFRRRRKGKREVWSLDSWSKYRVQFKSQYWYLCTDSLDRLDSLASSQWPQTWPFWMGWFPEKVGNETCIHNSLLTYEILGPMDCTHIYTCIDTDADRWGEAREPRLRFSWPAQVRRSKVAVGCEHYRN